MRRVSIVFSCEPGGLHLSLISHSVDSGWTLKVECRCTCSPDRSRLIDLHHQFTIALLLYSRAFWFADGGVWTVWGVITCCAYRANFLTIRHYSHRVVGYRMLQHGLTKVCFYPMCHMSALSLTKEKSRDHASLSTLDSRHLEEPAIFPCASLKQHERCTASEPQSLCQRIIKEVQVSWYLLLSLLSSSTSLFAVPCIRKRRPSLLT